MIIICVFATEVAYLHYYCLLCYYSAFVYCLVDQLFTCLPQDADGPATEVVVEAEVLVATDVQKLLVGKDKLEGRQKVEEGYTNQLP